jgi:hypothetical protein
MREGAIAFKSKKEAALTRLCENSREPRLCRGFLLSLRSALLQLVCARKLMLRIMLKAKIESAISVLVP